MDQHSCSVAILMATYNGDNYLLQQLNSFIGQTHKNWHLYVSDDGSQDKTLEYLYAFQSKNSRCSIFNGPRLGFARNFMALIDNSNIEADFFAFSDQDDIWLEDKLETALNFLSKLDNDKAAMYCSRTSLIDENSIPIGLSPHFVKKPCFGNSIIQNIASGNTMVFNKKARELLRLFAGKPLIVHDWSLYQVVTGCGGTVFYDKKPTILYRQHGNNLIGNGMHLSNRFRNFKLTIDNGQKILWNNVNLKNLLSIKENLTTEAINIIDVFFQMRSAGLFKRLHIYIHSGLHHQTMLGSITNFCYAIFNKL